MSIVVDILNTATGETRTLLEKGAWVETRIPGDVDQADGIVFWWTEGNGGCDCNRGSAFERAGGADKDEQDFADFPCHAESQYLVRVTIDDVIVFDELARGQETP